EITVSNQGIEFSDELALSYEAMLKTYFEAVFDKPHKELKEAWAALIMARSTGAITEAKYNELLLKLGKPLVTMKEAQELNDRILKDSAFANEKSLEWAEAKKKIYLEVLSEVGRLVKACVM
ncbi:MAG: hypothetical protein ACE5K0_12470, partial [Candidatus Methanofastidiosia archaeon]